MSRTRYHRLGAVVLVLVFNILPMFPPLIQVAAGVFNAEDVFFLPWAILGVLLAYVLFSARVALALFAVDVVVMSAFSLLLPVVGIEVLFPLLFMGSLLALGAFVHVYYLQRASEQAQRLAESQQQFRHITENLKDVLWQADPSGVITYLSPSSEGVLGASAEAGVGQTVYALCDALSHPDDTTRLKQFFAEVLQTTENRRISATYRVRHADGYDVWMETVATPAFADNGTVNSYVFNSRDVTERVQTEREKEAALRFTESLQHSVAAVNSTLDLDAVLDAILKQIAQTVPPFSTATVILIDGEMAKVVRTYGALYDLEHVKPAVMNLTFRVDEMDNLRHVYNTGEAVYIPDVTLSPNWKTKPFSEWMRCHLALPINAEGRVIGFVTLASTVPNAFPDYLPERLKVFTEFVGTAIRNARLYEQVKSERELAESLREGAAAINATLELDAVLDTILNRLSEVVPNYAAANIILLRGDRIVSSKAHGEKYRTNPSARLVIEGYSLKDIPNLQHVYDTGKARYLPDVSQHPGWLNLPPFAWIKSHLSMPIRAEGQIIGFLNLDGDKVDAFSETLADELVIFTEQAGTAIRNARLYESARAERELSDTLRDISLVLNSSLSLDEVMATMLQQVARVLPYDAAAVWLDRGDGVIQAQYTTGYEKYGVAESVKEIGFRAGENPLVGGTIMILPRVEDHPDWEHVQGFEWAKSWICGPIFVRGAFIGQLTLDHEQPGFYTEKYRPIMEAVMAQVSIAFANARSFETERRQRETLEFLQQGSMKLTASLDLHEVLSSILDTVNALLDNTGAYLYVYDDDTLIYSIATYKGEIVETPPKPRENGLTARVRQAGTLLAFPNLRDPTLADPFRLQDDQKAVIGVPLKIGGEMVGVLNVTFGESRPHFDDLTLRVAEMVASQAAIAVQNARLFDNVQRERVLADTLRDISLILSSSLSQEDIVIQVLQQVRRVLPYDAAAFWVKQQNDVFHPMYLVGYEQFDAAEKLKRVRFKLEDALKHGDNIAIVSDTQTYPDWDDYAGFEWVKSWMQVPIYLHGEMVARMTLDHTQAGTYTERHRAIAESLQAQVTVAFGNARLYEAESRKRSEIETIYLSAVNLTSTLDLNKVLRQILISIDRLYGVESAMVVLYDEVTDTITPGMVVERGAVLSRGELPFELRENGVVRHVIRRREAFFIDDMREHDLYNPQRPPWWRESAVVGLPLMMGDNLLGVLLVGFGYVYHFEENERQLLRLLAVQASVAVENARLYEEISRYAEDLEGRVAERTLELDEERARLQSIFDATGEGIFYANGEIIKYSNPAMCAMLGYTQQEMMGKSWTAIADPTLSQQDLATLIEEIYIAFEEKGVWRSESRMRRKDGSLFYAGFSISVIGEPKRGASSVVAVVRDISREKELEAQKTRFIANASHELRTPLTNLMTRLHLARRRPDLMDEHLDVMDRVSDPMHSLIKDLLDVSRFERGVIALEIERVLLQDLVGEVVELQKPEAADKDIFLLYTKPSEPIYVNADPGRFTQVITNLVMNAINYTHPGGQVMVVVLMEAAKNQAVVRVQDTGVGISEAHQKHIFEAFYRAEGDKVGTGLGLSIAKEIVDLHGGEISVDSVPGRGARFSVTLRLADKGESEREHEPETST